MKRLLLLVFIVANYAVWAATYTSVAAGGNWNSSATWTGGPVGTFPGVSDNVIIATSAGKKVVINVASTCNNITINSGSTLYVGAAIGVYGLLTNNGIISASANISFRANGTVIAGGGSWTSFNGGLYFCGPSPSSQTIAAGVNIVKTSGAIYLDCATTAGNVTVTNLGSVTLNAGILNTKPTHVAEWINGANSYTQVGNTVLVTSTDLLSASASNNTFVYSGAAAFNMKTPVDAYNNLTIAGTSTISAGGTIALTNLVVNSGSKLNIAGHNMSVAGNWTNNGTITNNTSTITFNGSGTQTIGGTVSTTFENITEAASGTVQLGINTLAGGNVTINSGTFNCSSFNLNVGGNFTDNAIFLGATGTVIFNGSGIQTIGGTTSTTFNNITESGTGTVQLGINTAASDNLTLSSGTFMCLAHNLSVGANFTNNATFIAGTGTVFFNGSGIQTIGGTTSTTFNNITESGTGTIQLGINTAATGNVTISSGIFNGSTFDLNIGGNLVNNGTFTAGTGTITMNGSAAQSIGGTSSISFYDLTIAGTSTVSLTKNESFTDLLTMTSGTLGGADTMTLVATAAKTARIAAVGAGASVTAMFKMQVYVNRSTKGYGFWASPAKSETLWDLNNSRSPNFFIPDIQGIDGLDYKIDQSVYQYSEITEKYDSIVNGGFVFTPGEGIMIYIRNSITAMAPSVFRSNGVPNVGNVTVGVTYTTGTYAGHTELGNPYASPIDWSSFYADNSSKLQSTFYTMNTGGTQVPFTSGSIAMNQGFAVNATSAGTITFKESHKTAVNSGFMAPNKSGDPAEELNAVELTLSNNANEYYCPTILSFGNNYSRNYDPTEDAVYLNSPIHDVPLLYTVSEDNRNLILNRMPDVDQNLDIPLTAIGQVAANYTLTMSGLNKLSSYNCISLIDKTTGQVLVNFENTPTYTFTISYPGEVKNYVLHLTKLDNSESCSSVTSVSNNILIPDNVDVYSTLNGAVIGFHLSTTEHAIVSVYNMLGEKVINDIFTSAYQNQLTVNLNSGQVYIVRIETTNAVIIKKLYH
jgi:hypothetical protein